MSNLCFTLDLDKINEFQLKTLRETIRRAKHAHHTDIDMRINGENVYFEADWLKHLVEKKPVVEEKRSSQMDRED